MTFDVLRKKKAVEIALALLAGAKGVREIRDSVGGSYTTIGKRLRELLKAGIIAEESLTGMEYGKRPLPKRLMRLTNEGRELVQSLVQSSFLKLPSLQKERQKWIMLLLWVLKTIRGRTRFMKLLFLLKFKFGLKKGNSFKFKPWIYGPYSKDVAQDLRELREDGLIFETPESYRRSEFREEEILYIYTLTPEGAKLTQELLVKISHNGLKELENLRPFNEMTLDKLLEYIYYNYPKFVTHSAIVKRILAHARTNTVPSD